MKTNSWVRPFIKKYKGKYTFEFDLLGYQPEEWTPENSLIVIRMIRFFVLNATTSLNGFIRLQYFTTKLVDHLVSVVGYIAG